MSGLARVALDVPLFRLFDYRCGSPQPEVGQRVVVPFGRRRVVGVVVEHPETSDLLPGQLKTIEAVLAGGQLAAEDLRLLRFASDYYHYPLGQVVNNALPQQLKRTGQQPKKARAYRLTNAGRSIEPVAVPARARTQRALLAVLQHQPVVAHSAVLELGSTAREALRALLGRGWIECTDPVEAFAQSPTDPHEHPTRPALTPAQQSATDVLLDHLDGFGATLLYGVTGSGKTEVYLRICEAVLQRGGQVLLLVPEIALTPQLERTVQARFPRARLVSLHSGLSDSERAANWLAGQRGEANIVLGTRLAVFTPLPRLRLVVVDEEHDPSLKQSEGFCYSARDLAVVRAHMRDVPVLLGSATPSLESYSNAQSGRYRLVELRERVNARPPTIRCIPLDGARKQNGLATELLQAIAQRLESEEQTLIFINRRGYAPVLMCHACSWLSGCFRCTARMVLHQTDRRLHCHHCGHTTRVPEACPDCGNVDLSPLGQGTQRIEEALNAAFPTARVLRIDRDTTRRKHTWNRMLDRVRAREVDILVGTQMLAKGHDFPHLALVGVLNADSLLYSTDFRASERLYALLTQVAGRAGRAQTSGEVLIQTEFPDHPLYAALRDQDMHRFANQLLHDRGASGFPPYVHQALLRAEAAELEVALQFLQEAAQKGRRAAVGGVELFDPVPAAMVRLAGRERAQLLVQSPSRAALHQFLAQWVEELVAQRSTAARWTLEVDPAEL